MAVTDYFRLLNLPHRASLSESEVRSAFQAARGRPEAETGSESTAEAVQQQLQEAFHCLERPATRLGHLQSVLGHTPARSATISEPMMALFSRLTPALQAADVLFAKKTSATSHLAKALLSKELLATDETLTNLGGEIMQLLEQLHHACTAWDDRVAEEKHPADLAPIQQGFAFLEKWERELVRRRLELVG